MSGAGHKAPRLLCRHGHGVRLAWQAGAECARCKADEQQRAQRKEAAALVAQGHSPGPREVWRHWSRYSMAPHWTVSREWSHGHREHLQNERGRTKRFRSEAAAQTALAAMGDAV